LHNLSIHILKVHGKTVLLIDVFKNLARFRSENIFVMNQNEYELKH